MEVSVENVATSNDCLYKVIERNRTRLNLVLIMKLSVGVVCIVLLITSFAADLRKLYDGGEDIRDNYDDYEEENIEASGDQAVYGQTEKTPLQRLNPIDRYANEIGQYNDQSKPPEYMELLAKSPSFTDETKKSNEYEADTPNIRN